MYNLSDDLIHTIPKFYDNAYMGGLKPLVSLDEGKEMFKKWISSYDWKNKENEHLKALEKIKTVFHLNQFAYNIALKGAQIKQHINNNLYNKNG